MSVLVLRRVHLFMDPGRQREARAVAQARVEERRGGEVLGLGLIRVDILVRKLRVVRLGTRELPLQEALEDGQRRHLRRVRALEVGGRGFLALIAS